MKYNIWNKWDPLRVVMLGNTFAPEYFHGIGGKVEDPLKRIQEETLVDLDYFKSVLKDFGAEVIQPEIDPNERFIDQDGSWVRRRRAPLQPRDNHLVMGNTLVKTGYDHPAIHKCIDDYNDGAMDVMYKGQYLLLRTIEQERYNYLRGEDWPAWERYANFDDGLTDIDYEIIKEINSYECLIPAPNITVVGKDVYIDEFSDFYVEQAQQWADADFISIFKSATPHEFRTNALNIGGHNDGCFHTVGPGKIISTTNIQYYEKTFPGWDVHIVPNEFSVGNKHFNEMLNTKFTQQFSWWLPGEENNEEFTAFVNDWLGEWVGFVEETIFDVNVLMLDPHTVCVSNPHNEDMNAFFKKHKIEVVHVPWRHRFFHDGGLHCTTLDLVRDGVQEDYFPDRSGPLRDEGFDD